MRQALRARREALQAALAARLPPAVRWSPAEGGYFLWLELPPGLPATPLLADAQAAIGVAFKPGALFGGGDAALRLSFAHYPPEALADAAGRLADYLGERVAAL